MFLLVRLIAVEDMETEDYNNLIGFIKHLLLYTNMQTVLQTYAQFLASQWAEKIKSNKYMCWYL